MNKTEPATHTERQQAALAYVFSSMGSDPEPIHMVEAILAGQRDDVVRTLAKRGKRIMENV